MRATLIPAAPHQPLLKLQVPQQVEWGCAAEHGQAWMTQAMGAWVLDMIEGSPGAPLFSMAFRHIGGSSSTLFWMAHLQLHVNERAAEMAGVPDVRGDALVVSDYALSQSAASGGGTAVCKVLLSDSSCESRDVTVRSPVGKVSFRIDTFKHGACLEEVRAERKRWPVASGGARVRHGVGRTPHVDQGSKAACVGFCCVVRPKYQHKVLTVKKCENGKPENQQGRKHSGPRLVGRGGLKISPRTVLNFQRKLRESNAAQVADVASNFQAVEDGGDRVIEPKVEEAENVLQSCKGHGLHEDGCCQEHAFQEHVQENLQLQETLATDAVPVSLPESADFTDSKRLKLEATGSGVSTELMEEEFGLSGMDCLPGGLLQNIFAFLSFTDLSSCAAVCRHWKLLIGEDQITLRSLTIRYRSLASHMKAPPRAHASLSKTEQRIPFVLQCAADAGNLGAIVLVAQELEICGEKGKALTWYKQAARKGHQASQYKLGESYYRGSYVWQRDCQEALKWLQMAAKHEDEPDASICGAAAMMLGYMYLDGEGIDGADNSEAVKWFKIARDHGSMEAEKTVGWLWNTGQY